MRKGNSTPRRFRSQAPLPTNHSSVANEVHLSLIYVDGFVASVPTLSGDEHNRGIFKQD